MFSTHLRRSAGLGALVAVGLVVLGSLFGSVAVARALTRSTPAHLPQAQCRIVCSGGSSALPAAAEAG